MATQTNTLMIVRLSLHQWYPKKLDKRAGDEIARFHGAESGAAAGDYRKLLVSTDSIKPLQQRFRELRDRHYAMTAPYSDNGDRVLPSALYFDYVEMVRDARQEIDALADAFVYTEYDAQRFDAHRRLGTLFDQDDYPDLDTVRNRFSVSTEVEPLPNPDARFYGVGEDQAQQIAAEVRDRIEAKIQAAQANIVEQVANRAREFVTKVGAYDKGDTTRLYDTAVTNLTDVVALVLRGLNVTGDLELEKLAKELETALTGTDADTLKTAEGERRARIAAVNKVVAKFDGIYGS